MNTIPKGQRHASLFLKANELLYEGMSKEDVCKVLDRMNVDRCRPPLSSGRVKHLKNSVMKWMFIVTPEGEKIDIPEAQ